MAFEELSNDAPSKVEVPDKGVVVGSRAAGRGDKKTRYLAIMVGKQLAKDLGFHLAVQKVRVMAGTGDDEGKLAIDADATKGKFVAKKQTAGHYLVTVNRNSVGGRFALEFEKTIIPEPRFIPSVHGKVPMVVFRVPS